MRSERERGIAATELERCRSMGATVTPARTLRITQGCRDICHLLADSAAHPMVTSQKSRAYEWCTDLADNQSSRSVRAVNMLTANCQRCAEGIAGRQQQGEA